MPQVRWVATEKTQNDGALSAAGLSIRQRKILSVLTTPSTVEALADITSTPKFDVEAILRKLAAAGLVRDADVSEPQSHTIPTPIPPPVVLSAAPVNPVQAIAAPLPPPPAQPSLRENVATLRIAPTRPASHLRLPVLMGLGALAVATVLWFLSRPSTPPAGTSAATVAARPALATTDIAPTSAPSVGTPPAVAVPTPAAVAPPAATREPGLADPPAKVAAASKLAVEAPTTAAPREATPPASTLTAPVPAPAAIPTPVAEPEPASAASPTVVAAATGPVATPSAISSPAAPAPSTPAAATPVAAKATPPATAAPREGRLLERVDPAFPRGATNESGLVRARVNINATGAVTGVEIVSANPPLVFDRSVRAALLQWKYEATGEASSRLVDISFQR